MTRADRIKLALGGVLLLYGTVAVFVALDRHSHSGSDTLMPFVITMAPVWAVAIAATRVLLRRGRPLRREDVTRWLERYVAAWKSGARDEIEALFSHDARYRFHA